MFTFTVRILPDFEIKVKTLEIFADYANLPIMRIPKILLNGFKSIETGLRWTKLDGSPLNYTGKFEDVDYGFTVFSENQIHGNAAKIISRKQ